MCNFYTLKKDSKLLELALSKPLLCNSPGTDFNRDYYFINKKRTSELRGKLPACAAASSGYAQKDLKSSITLIFNRVTFNEL